MKCYLLMAGDSLCPRGGTLDWRGCYRSREEATKSGEKWLKQQRNPGDCWFKVVDLDEWMETEDA